MKNRLLVSVSCSLLLSAVVLRGQAANEATLYRDEFGIPHVYAPTLEAAAFAVGYAQAEDRLEELLKNYRRANGTMSEVFGPSHFRNDFAMRLFRHDEISREKYGQLSPKSRAVIEAYQAGDQAVHERTPRAGAELGPGNPSVGRGGSGALYYLGLGPGRCGRGTHARGHYARCLRLSRLQ